MLYLIQHKTIVLLFFTIPIVGYFLSIKLSPKALSYILYSAAVLLLPVLIGYYYILPYTGSALLYIILSCWYALTAGKKGYNWNKSLIHTLIYFFTFGMLSFFGEMMGTVNVENEWHVKNYKIQYIQDRGFSGGPLFTYELSKYAALPIFIRHVDTKVDDDSTHNCMITFKNEGFTFDKCKIAPGIPSITVDTVKKTITTTSLQPETHP